MESLFHKSAKEVTFNEVMTTSFLLVIEYPADKYRLLQRLTIPSKMQNAANEEIKEYLTIVFNRQNSKGKIIKISRVHQIEKAVKI